jgi:hypothetical protein
VDVKEISSPILGTEDIPPFGEKKASRWDRHYLFLIRRKVEWSLAWDAIIEREHSDLENNVEDDTWFEEDYETKDVDHHVLPGGRVVFGVKTPEDNAKEVAAKKAEKLATKKKKEDEAAAKKRKRAAGRENVRK